MAKSPRIREKSPSGPNPEVAGEVEDLFEHCERVLDYRFSDLSHLREALTHASGDINRLV